eukprot:scaffold432_cov69-Cyclotella_meneghiniana.AAC.16
MPVVSQSPVAKSPHFAPAHGGAARQASGMWYDWQALASQWPHSPGDWLTTAPVVSQSPGVNYQATATGRRGQSCAG